MTAHAINISPFWTIVWKEYRQSRGFWLAMVVIGVCSQLLLRVFGEGVFDYQDHLFRSALGIAAFYSAGVAATMFAVEHEERTFEFLRRLPVSAGVLFVAKVAFAIFSVLAMQLVLSLSGWYLADGHWISPDSQHELIRLWGLASVEGLVWGIAFSMLIKWPLRAAFCTLVATTVGIHLAACLAFPHQYLFLEYHYLRATPYRIAIIGVVALFDIWLAHRWFEDRIFRPLFLFHQAAIAPSIANPEELGFQRQQAFWSLLWQAWRQARWSLALLIPLGALVATCRAFPPFVGIVAALHGAFVFRADQHLDSRRFLAQRGVSARAIWITRQLVWLALLSVWVAAVIGLVAAFDLPNSSLPASFLPLRVLVVLVVALAAASYAAGQLASLLIRSGILAGVAAVLLAGLIAAWAGLMFTMKINWLWSVLPIVITLFVVTWVRTPGWLLERNDLRSWIRPLTALVLPIAAVVIGVAAYRVYQIPAMWPNFGRSITASKDNPAARETLELYRRVWDLHQSSPSHIEDPNDGQIDVPNEEAYALLTEASRRLSCHLGFDGFGTYRDLEKIKDLCSLVIKQGILLQRQGNLDEAFDRYLIALHISRQMRTDIRGLHAGVELQNDAIKEICKWSAMPGQTPERIKEALHQLKLFHRLIPALSTTLEPEYDDAMWMIDHLSEAVSRGWIDVKTIPTSIWVESHLPFERARAKRLINFVMAGRLKLWEQLDAELASGSNTSSGVLFIARGDGSLIPLDEKLFLESTPLAAHLAWNHYSLLLWSIYGEMRFRATLTLLALESWRLSHGELPQKLEDLVSTELKELPHDPFTGRPFVYFPRGISQSMLEQSYLGSLIVEFNQPFLWSPAPPIVQNIQLPLPWLPDQLEHVPGNLNLGTAFTIPSFQKEAAEEPKDEEVQAAEYPLSPPGPSEE